MSASTGPILTVGAITIANQTLINNKPLDLRVPIATGIAAGFFSLLDKGWPELSKGLAYLALITVLFVRVDGSTPSPAESLAKFMKEK